MHFLGGAAGARTEKEPNDRSLYSQFLFVGDSLFQYWLCFDSYDVRASPNFAKCISVIDMLLENTENLPVVCSESRAPAEYCKSLFSAAFPGALNMGRHGWRVKSWTIRLGARDAVMAKLESMSNIEYLVVELGANNIRGAADERFIQNVLAEFEAFLALIHVKFPRCQILLVSTLPRPFLNVNESIRKLNALLRERFLDNALFPSVHFVDVTQHFLGSDGRVNAAAYIDDTHLNAFGYEIFERVLKMEIHRLFLE